MAGKRAKFTLKQYRELCQKSTKLEKGNLLVEFCRITHYHRKYAIRLLKGPAREVKSGNPSLSNTASKYSMLSREYGKPPIIPGHSV